jgi:MoaA/NifB/PqqE/SkfB family radical SAM enzyme
MMTKRGLKSYFSCNPANINLEGTIETFENGLDYVKYSWRSVDDLRHKEVRGQQSNFSESYKKILKLLDVKAQRNLKTTIVITMINLN